MNKKGFAISIILYVIVFLIITIFYILLAVVKSRYNTGNNIRKNIVDSLNSAEYIYSNIDNDKPVNTLIINPNGGSFKINQVTKNDITSITKYAGDTITLSNADRSDLVEANGTFTISYNANGGDTSPDDVVVEASHVTEYTFVAWEGEENCGVLTDGTYTFPSNYGTECTKTASWTSTESDKGEPITLPAAINRDGYTFTGWKSSTDNTIYNANESFTATADTIMTAQWEEE